MNTQSKTRENKTGFPSVNSQGGEMEGHTPVVSNELKVVLSQQGGRTRSAAFYLQASEKRQKRHLGQARGREVNTPSLHTSLIMYMAVHKNSHDCREL